MGRGRIICLILLAALAAVLLQGCALVLMGGMAIYGTVKAVKDDRVYCDEKYSDCEGD